MEKYEMEIEFLSDVVENKKHPISGKDKVNWDDIPDSKQLEMRGHLTDGGTYGLPMSYFNGCIRDYFVDFCPWGNDGQLSSKDKRKSYISSKVRIVSLDGSDLIDTGIIKGSDLFDIKKDGISIINQGAVSLSFPVQPVLKVKGKKYKVLVVSAVDDRPMEEVKKLLNDSGLVNGAGSWRNGGKGKFKVVNCKKVK